MFDSEYIKSMNCNFERIKLEENPEEKRYQYCIINRGGIRGLLPCSLRVINGDAYLYYDITSKQGLGQMFRRKTIGRQWIKDFVWNLKRISCELNRFLLDISNVIWYPDKIFQDLEDNRWSFLYFPYYKGENGFRNLLEFIIEKIDYQDEKLVECAYKMYEQYDCFGADYLVEKIYKDVMELDNNSEAGDLPETETDIDVSSGPLGEGRRMESMNHPAEDIIAKTESADVNADKKPVSGVYEFGRNMFGEYDEEADGCESADNGYMFGTGRRKEKIERMEKIDKRAGINVSNKGKTKERKGLLSFWESTRKKDKEAREKNRIKNHYILDGGIIDESAERFVDGVAEASDFYKCDKASGEIGKTVYIENVAEDKDNRRRLFDSDGKMLCLLEEDSVVIGKKRDESDMVIDNASVSRVHARIFYSNGDYMLEDLNSTNGTFKNGLRLKPYEKRKLMQGDEIKLGSVALMYN